MFRELLSKLTAEDVEYAFEYRVYAYPDRPFGLRDFLFWFNDSDLYSFLHDYNEDGDFFAGFMTCISLLAAVAIEQGREDEFRHFVDSIPQEFVHMQVYGEHPNDCVFEYVNELEESGPTAIRERMQSSSMPFADSFYNMMQVLYSFEYFAAGLGPEEKDEFGPDFEGLEDAEGEILEEEDYWPEYIG